MLRKRKRRQRKPHQWIHGIEHKYCNSCNQWKTLGQFGKNGNRKRSNCKDCKKNKNKEHHKLVLENRKKARKEARQTGFLVCLNTYCKINPWLQNEDQFINELVRKDTFTMHCLTCRKKHITVINQSDALLACKRVWDDWRKTHRCVKCVNDPNYKHNYLVVEADHLPNFKKLKACSEMRYWATKSRGVPALLTELKKCQALCRFHHQLQTQQRSSKTKRKDIISRRARINKEKYRRGCCFLCKRPVRKGEERGFDFDHLDPTTKFMYNGKAIGPSSFVFLSQSLFDKQWPLEQAKCTMLCTNCHKLKTFANRDGYKK